ncbi:MAG: Ig-like domain-containing protein [Catonella sp.]|uniref:Ig-like domain-containing protein n=1 Tax=Catonella sp. TaxID=2382125 RepID=UPI003FA14900
MRSKQAKICSLILATAITSTFSTLPYTAKAMTEKKGVIYVTKKDVKNGKVVISKKTAKSIVIKKSVGKATIQLKNVKLSGELAFEKGNYVLKSSKSSVKTLKITGTDTKIKLNKESDFNNKNLILKVAKNTMAKVDLSEYGKKITAELGKATDIALTMGNSKASVVVKKADITSKLNIKGKGEDASISKIRVESPVSLTVNINAETLETSKKANTAVIDIEKKVGDIKNEAGSSIQDKETERIKAEKEKVEKEKAEKEKAEKEKAEKEKAEKEKAEKEKTKETTPTGNTGGGYYGGGSAGGGSFTPSKPEKKTTKITLNKTSDITTDAGKTKITVTYEPSDATDKNLVWTIKEGVGIAKIISSNSNEAEIEALANGTCKIEAKVSGSNVKAETEITINNQDSNALENRIKEYLTYTADRLNKDIYEDVNNMGAELTAKIQEKINGHDNKANWAEHKKNVETKVKELEEKIRNLKDAENAAVQAIGNAYENIKAGNDLDPETAKTAVDAIEEKRKTISEKAFKTKLGNVDLYNEIKAEVEEYKKIEEFKRTASAPTIGDNGVVLFDVLNVAAKYELIKNENNTIESKDLQAGVDRIDLLKQMRKAGVGKYIVKLVKDFKHLKGVEIGKSNEKEVKLLEKKWGGDSNRPPVYEYDGNEFKHKDGTGNTIRLVNESGKWLLKWDEVDNATTYDIIAGISVLASEGNLGSYNLTSTENDYQNVENEFEYTELSSVAKRIKENKNNDKRSMVAVNHHTTSIELDKFIPVKGDGVGEDFWDGKESNVTVDIWIIPRNQNSLYVSNMKEYLKAGMGAEAKSNKFFIEGTNNGNNFKLKDFYKIFYGEELTQ